MAQANTVIVHNVSAPMDKSFSNAKSVLYNFKTANVIQLISATTGKSLQIVTIPTGQLVLDGNGPKGEEAIYAKWTVMEVGGNRVRLQNNGNYLSIVNGETCLVNYPPTFMPGNETILGISQSGQNAVIESGINTRCHIGVLKTGQLKPASTTGKAMDAQWAVKLMQQAPPGMVGAPIVMAQPGMVQPQAGADVMVIQQQQKM